MPLTAFKDPLPVPATINLDDGVERTVIMREIPAHSFHSELPSCPVWGFECEGHVSSPGPTFEVTQGRTSRLAWQNQLPSRYPMQLEFASSGGTPGNPHGGHSGHTGMGHCNMGTDVSPVPGFPIGLWQCMNTGRAVAHLHGAHVAPSSDGWPENPMAPGGAPHRTEYPNAQQAATLWYHDHSMHVTRLNVYAGLAGGYIVRALNEATLGLPAGDHEVPLVIQDRLLKQYSSSGNPVPTPLAYDLAGIPEFFATTMCVNGKAWPRHDVQPHRYRFRVVNGCNSRALRLSFQTLDASANPTGPLLPFFIIGSDGSFLPAPAAVDKLVLAPGERADLIMDFSSFAPGTRLQLTNDAEYPFKGGNPTDFVVDPLLDGRIMAFDVIGATAPDNSTNPANLNLPVDLTVVTDPATGARQDLAAYVASNPAGLAIRQHQLVEIDMPDGSVMPLLDGKNWDADPANFDSVQAGEIQVWEIENTTVDTHPIHLHLVQFRVIGRRRQVGGVVTTFPPEPHESGWKDTVQCHPGPIPDASGAKAWNEVTIIAAKFDLPPGADPAVKHAYVWHCHMLEHEDHDMMRPLIVVPPPAPIA